MARTTLVSARSISLDAGTPLIESAPIIVPPQTEALSLSLQRPTTAVPLDWDSNGTMRVSLILRVDGIEYPMSGQVTGGVRDKGLGRGEHDVYQLSCELPMRRSAQTGSFSRLGEGASECVAFIRLQRLRGSITTFLTLCVADDAPAPQEDTHNSVAYDNAASASESGGDGTLDVSITVNGTSQLAAFAGVGWDKFPTVRSTSVTWDFGGTAIAMTEQWDAQLPVGDVYNNAGYTLANNQVLTGGPKTVRNVIAGGATDNHYFGVITMTGVDQATPVGTPQTASGSGVSPLTVTVTGVGTDDLICDNLFDNSVDPTIGANQVSRNAIDNASQNFRQSTKLGSFGSGVMSWTATATGGLGAIAFKAGISAGNLAWVTG